MARHKYWNHYPIGQVMRALWKAGWDSTKITTFFVRAGINVSTNTVNTERHKLKTGAIPADLTDREWDEINEIMGRDFTPPRVVNADDEPDDDTNGSPTKPLPAFDLSKLVTLLESFKTDLGAKLDILEAKMDEQDSKIAQIEDIALGSCKKMEITMPDGIKLDLDEATHPCLEEVVKMVQGLDVNGKRERINVCLVGPAGAGKTFLCAQVAKVMKLDFDFLSFSGDMSASQLTGRLIPIGADGKFCYVTPRFVHIWENGGVYLFDEMDRGGSDVNVVLNAALDGKVLSLPSRHEKPYAKKHKDTILMAACNTFGTGADRQYVAAQQQDEAFLDRWRAGVVEVDYSPELEAKLCPDHELRTRLQGYRDNCRKAVVRRVISSRFIKQAYMLKCMGLEHRIDNALFGGWRTEEVNKAKGAY